jgi:DNA-binding transcriptional MerR regulator
VATVTIPNRPVFRAQEVCDLAEVQPYVLRTWEAEFPDLGFSKTGSGPRVYRRADVARVLRIKNLLFVDGLTLAGARRRLIEEGAVPEEPPVEDAEVAALVDEQTRQHLRDVKQGLQWILGVLSTSGSNGSDEFVLEAPRLGSPARPSNGKVTARPAHSGKSVRPAKPVPKPAAKKSGHKKR